MLRIPQRRQYTSKRVLAKPSPTRVASVANLYRILPPRFRLVRIRASGVVPVVALQVVQRLGPLRLGTPRVVDHSLVMNFVPLAVRLIPLKCWGLALDNVIVFNVE